MDVVLFVIALVIWVVVALLAMENLGINVGPLIAGLGVGGIAIALSVQRYSRPVRLAVNRARQAVRDRRYAAGGYFEGTVEQIGIKSTRLRSITGEQIIIANADLLKSGCATSAAPASGALFTLNIAYDTPVANWTRCPRWWNRRWRVIRARASCIACCANWVNRRWCTRYVFSSRTPRAAIWLRAGPGEPADPAWLRRCRIEFAHPTRTLLMRSRRTDGAAERPTSC